MVTMYLDPLGYGILYAGTPGPKYKGSSLKVPVRVLVVRDKGAVLYWGPKMGPLIQRKTHIATWSHGPSGTRA